MAIRTKRSVSLPPGLARDIERAAARERSTVSAWLATAAARRLKLDAGRSLIAEWERENGPFTPEELAEADASMRRVFGTVGRRRHRRTT
jgi:hypothetical protein